MVTYTKLLVGAAVVLVSFFGIGAAEATPYDQIIVFGDSLSDVGNYYRATNKTVPSALYYDVDPSAGLGRFSNDQLWVEHLASLYNTTAVNPLLPSSGKPAGTDYAWAYAEIDANVVVTSPVKFTVPSLPNQVATYLNAVKQKADPNALYVIWGGAADLIYDAEHKIVPNPSTTASHVAGMVSKLKAAGAVNFMLPTVPNVAAFPEVISLHVASSAANYVIDLNNAVTVALANKTLMAGITLSRPDFYRLQYSLTLAPTHFGFKDVVDSCLGLDVSVSLGSITLDGITEACNLLGPAYYVFWDGRNFAGFGNTLFAGQGVGATPEARGVPY